MHDATETEIGIQIERSRGALVARSREMRELSVRADNRQALLRDVPSAAAELARQHADHPVRVEADWRFPTDGSGPRIVLRMRDA